MSGLGLFFPLLNWSNVYRRQHALWAALPLSELQRELLGYKIWGNAGKVLPWKLPSRDRVHIPPNGISPENHRKSKCAGNGRGYVIVPKRVTACPWKLMGLVQMTCPFEMVILFSWHSFISGRVNWKPETSPKTTRVLSFNRPLNKKRGAEGGRVLVGRFDKILREHVWNGLWLPVKGSLERGGNSPSCFPFFWR